VRRRRVQTVEEQRTQTLGPKGRKAVWGAFVGFFVDMFDVYLPIVVLAPATIYFVSSDLSAPATAIVSGSIFAATLVGRPLGAIIFGHFADVIGRRRTTIISITGFGVCTLLMALLPGYQQWGIAAVIALIILRLVDGAFIGGEYSAANPLAMEYSPKEKRGLYAGIIQSGYPLAFAAISAITAVLLFLLPADGLNSPYVQWGWRIPFFIGAVLAFVMAAYFYFFVDESELFEASGGTESPLKTLFSGENFKNFLQVFVLMSGFWLSLNTVSAVLPGLLRSQVGLSNTNVTITLVIAYITVALSFVGAGALSQGIGRRTLLMWLGGLMAVVGTFLYYLLIGTTPDNLLMIILLTTIITVLVSSNWGLATSYINERFHTSVRASGFGIGYSLAVILPSFYAFYQAGLATFMPFEYTVLVLLVIGGLLILGGAAWGPETKDVDF
jgi:MFS family permease